MNKQIKENYGESKITDTLLCSSNLVINESYFKFNGKIFKQRKGVPMGSPVSNTLAELKMRLIEKEIMNIHGDEIKYWYRYVDDIFAVLEPNVEPEQINNSLNVIDKNIKFTYEVEKDNRLNYLDVEIRKIDENIETTVYRKQNAINEIINAKCKTPTNYKIAAIRSYINRAILVCSNQNLLNEELSKIKEIGMKAGYPLKLINKIFDNRLKKLDIIDPAQKPIKQFTYAIPFDRGISLKLQREAAKHNVHVPIKPNKSIFQRVRSDKEMIDKTETAGVYRISYKKKDGSEGVYIGMTKRKINKRIEEHISDVKYGRSKTALSQLCMKENVDVNFKNVKKIANFINTNCTLYREAIEITLDKRACNLRDTKIDERWDYLLNKIHGTTS